MSQDHSNFTFGTPEIILVFIIACSMLIISAALYQDCKAHKDANVNMNNKNDKNVRTKLMQQTNSFFTSTIIAVVSFLTTYDLFGDIYFLSTLSNLYAESEILVVVDNGIAACNSAEKFMCQPYGETPYYSASNSASALGWDLNNYLTTARDPNRNIIYSTLPKKTITGYTCNQIFDDNRLMNDDYLYYDFILCVNTACEQCVNSCNGRPIYVDFDSTQYASNDVIGIVNCSGKNVSQAYPVVSILSFVLLSIILLKETIKTLLILTYFFSKQAQTFVLLKIAMNSPLTGFFVVSSDRFYNNILKIKQNESTRRTLGLFLDLICEDVPQFILSFWYYSQIGYQFQQITIISLTGSFIMTVINALILIKHLCKDYKATLSDESTQLSSEIQMQKTKQNKQKNDVKFEQWFRDNVHLTVNIDQYLKMLLDEGIDNFEIAKTITMDELKEIGITKLGHRKTIYLALQKLNQQSTDCIT
eukprot:543761_1